MTAIEPDVPASPLIDARTLAARQRAGAVGVLLDARANAQTYAEGHLPGAQHACLESQLSAAQAPGSTPRYGGRHPLPPLAHWRTQLGAWGITPHTPVVVYDDQSGALAAARAWWMLRAVGHTQVQVLDGGLSAALKAGLGLTTDATPSRPQPPYSAERWCLPIVDADEVEHRRLDADWRVLDVRSAERYAGHLEPLDPIAGHIPGALNLSYANHLAYGQFKSAAELRSEFERILGPVPARQLMVHCGSGVTACHSLLALELAGLPGAALYVGGWSEWCRGQRPMATGIT